MSLRTFLRLWSVLWHVGLPLVLAYLWVRSRKDPLYLRHLPERFGRYGRDMPGAVWIHAVSLGEVRSAIPLARALLDRGERVVMTHITPAGRLEASRVLAADIAGGRAASVWLPFETSWAYRGFFRSFEPRAGLVMEVEHWPRMVLAAEARGIPLFPCNAQYPLRSYDRDRTARRWRWELMRHYAGAFVKSELQAERFRATGLAPVVVTGETRFDQPVPERLLTAGKAIRQWLAPDRLAVTFASVVEGEDETYVAAIKALWNDADARRAPRPAILYVPRRPERFDTTADALERAGIAFVRRSRALGAGLEPLVPPPAASVLLCDSLGEMYAFLSAADRVVVGGGFTPEGAHNIIEPLAVGRPVITGPVTWPIEYPFAEAEAAGVARSVESAADLAEALVNFAPQPAEMERFFAEHTGAVARTLAAFERLTRR